MKFSVEMEIHVAPHDADVMHRIFSDAVIERFRGTAVRIERVLVIKDEEGERIRVDRPATEENWKKLLWECLTELNAVSIAEVVTEVFNEQGVDSLIEAFRLLVTVDEDDKS